MRYTPSQLPDTIPVFPLPGALLLPRARLPLHIFEPRYIAMLDDAIKTPERIIGMIQPVVTPGNKDRSRLHEIGCAGRIVSFAETEDGRYMISLQGIARYRIEETKEGFAPYLKADVDWSEFLVDLEADKPDPDFERDDFLRLLTRYFSSAQLESDWDTLKDAEEELLINSLAMLCPFVPEEKQALLEARDLATRRATLITLMEIALRGDANQGQMQ